jgi:tetratricopeptide (TPR) repeat protein
MGKRFGRRELILLLFSTAAGLGAAELAARVFLPPLPERQELADAQLVEQEAAPLEPFFRLSDGVWRPVRPGSVGESFPERRPAGAALVFVAGESVARLLPSETVRRALEPALGKPVQVVNAGVGGYSLNAVSVTVAELARYRPDAIVVLAGNNQLTPLLPRWALAVSRRSRLARLALDAWRDHADSDRAFERRLRALAASAAGTRLVLCTLPVNRWAPPVDLLPLENPRFRRGWLAWLRGDRQTAARAWTRFALFSPKMAAGRYWLGRALLAQGRLADGRAELDAGVELAKPCVTPLRNRLIRRVAADTGAALADLDAAFDAAGADGDAFKDTQHWEEPWKPVAAAVIAAALTGKAASPSALRPRPEPALPARRVGDTLGMAWSPRPLGYERAEYFYERLWRRLPKETALALASREGARAALRGTAGEVFMPLTYEDWRAAADTGAEALWRLGRREESRALLAKVLASRPQDRRARVQQLLHEAWEKGYEDGDVRVLARAGHLRPRDAEDELEDYSLSGQLERLEAGRLASRRR